MARKNVEPKVTGYAEVYFQIGGVLLMYPERSNKLLHKYRSMHVSQHEG